MMKLMGGSLMQWQRLLLIVFLAGFAVTSAGAAMHAAEGNSLTVYVLDPDTGQRLLELDEAVRLESEVWQLKQVNFEVVYQGSQTIDGVIFDLDGRRSEDTRGPYTLAKSWKLTPGGHTLRVIAFWQQAFGGKPNKLVAADLSIDFEVSVTPVSPRPEEARIEGIDVIDTQSGLSLGTLDDHGPIAHADLATGAIDFTARLTSGSFAKYVVFLLNDKRLNRSTSAPYVAFQRPKDLDVGTHTLTVQVFGSQKTLLDEISMDFEVADDSGPTEQPCEGMNALECELLQLTNQARTQAGQNLAPFTVHDACLAHAQGHAAALALANKDQFIGCWHSNWQQTSFAHGENIACGHQSVADVIESWMNSSVHRQNILRSAFTSIGIGVAQFGNSLVAVQCFSAF
jgi:uncharacterized protein YkwD